MHDDINSGGGYFMHHIFPFTVVPETDQNRQVGCSFHGRFCTLIIFPGSEITRVQTVGLRVEQKPITLRLLRIAAGVCGIVIAWLFLPDLPAIVIGGILFYVLGAWLDDRVKSRGRNIDQLLPIAIGRTAAGLLAGGSVPDVLQQVGESLEIEKTNPLTPEFILTASEMRIKDRVEALRSLASRSPSELYVGLIPLLF